MNVLFLGVLRAADGVLLASEQCNKTFEISVVKKTISATTTKELIPCKRYAVDSNELSKDTKDDQYPPFTIYYFMSKNKNVVYLCVVAKTYPLRLAYSLLSEIETYFEETTNFLQQNEKVEKMKEKGLNKKCRKFCQEIGSKYEDPASIDDLTRINEKVDLLKGQVASSVGILLENEETLQEMEQGTQRLVSQSNQLKRKSKAHQRQTYCNAIKNKCGISLLIILCLIIMLIPLFVYLSSMQQYNKNKTN